MNDTSTVPATVATLEVPDARLHYEVRGRGPLVVLVGAPMDASSFAPLADRLASDHTVLTTDPRGINRSPVADPDRDSTPEMRADDLSRLLTHLDAGPAAVVGSSGGAVSALALVQAHPELVHTVVAHEPPLDELLDDREQLRAQTEDIIATHLAGDVVGAWRKFLVQANITLPEGVFEEMFGGQRDPQAAADANVWFAHELRPTTRWLPRPHLPARGDDPHRGRHRRRIGWPALRPHLDRARRGAGHRAHHVPRRPHRVRRGPRPVRQPAARGPARELSDDAASAQRRTGDTGSSALRGGPASARSLRPTATRHRQTTSGDNDDHAEDHATARPHLHRADPEGRSLRHLRDRAGLRRTPWDEAARQGRPDDRRPPVHRHPDAVGQRSALAPHQDGLCKLIGKDQAGVEVTFRLEQRLS